MIKEESVERESLVCSDATCALAFWFNVERDTGHSFGIIGSSLKSYDVQRYAVSINQTVT
jgi:hypothetical protein